MSVSECCKVGFAWEGTPTGRVGKLEGLDCYIAGNDPTRAVLFLSDIFGWTLNNNRLLADHFAAESKSTVYVPDYFHGEVVDDDLFSNAAKRDAYDFGAWAGRHGKANRSAEIHAHTAKLKSQYTHVSAIGYCWGAWGVLQLAAKDKNLLSSAVVAHPSMLEHSEIDALSVPALFLAPEHDPTFTPELKAYTQEKVPTLGIDYVYAHFPGIMHGMLSKGDPNDPVQKRAFERAKNLASQFFVQYTH